MKFAICIADRISKSCYYHNLEWGGVILFIAKLHFKCINNKYFMWDMFFIVWYISSNNSKNLIKVQIYESQNSCKLLIWKKNNSYVGGRNNKDTLRFWTFELIWIVFTCTNTHTHSHKHTRKKHTKSILHMNIMHKLEPTISKEKVAIRIEQIVIPVFEACFHFRYL